MAYAPGSLVSQEIALAPGLVLSPCTIGALSSAVSPYEESMAWLVLLLQASHLGPYRDASRAVRIVVTREPTICSFVNTQFSPSGA
jgi:hypothetical protein